MAALPVDLPADLHVSINRLTKDSPTGDGFRIIE